jgi:hypothetical protein
MHSLFTPFVAKIGVFPYMHKKMEDITPNTHPHKKPSPLQGFCIFPYPDNHSTGLPKRQQHPLVAPSMFVECLVFGNS